MNFLELKMFLAVLNRLLLLPMFVKPKPMPPPEFLEEFLPFCGDLDMTNKDLLLMLIKYYFNRSPVRELKSLSNFVENNKR